MQQQFNSPSAIPVTSREDAHGAALKAVAKAVERLRFGTVQLTLHEGRIVQLDVTERQRFT